MPPILFLVLLLLSSAFIAPSKLYAKLIKLLRQSYHLSLDRLSSLLTLNKCSKAFPDSQ